MTTSSDPQPQQQEAPALKPYPLCGSTDLFLRDIAGWELDCRGCELSLVLADDPSCEGLIARWNTRADLPRATADDWSIAKSLVRDWLMERGVALSGVNGEVSRSCINRFKLDLQRRIVEAIANARAWAKSRAQKSEREVKGGEGDG